MAQKKEKKAKTGYPEIVGLAVEAVEAKMGRDVKVYDVRGRSSITDFFLVASAASGPQLKAISESVSVGLKKNGIHAHRKGGEPDSGWIVLDYIDLVIHLFQQEKREYYAIEELWEEKDR